MKKTLLNLAFLSSVLVPATSAFATTFTFMSSDGSGVKTDMMDLDHYSYYGWSIVNPGAVALGAELRSGRAVIQSATLQYKNIYNWTYEANDQLNSFLLSSPPPVPGQSESVPVVINGVPQGHNLYTYQKTTVATKTNTTGSLPAGYLLQGSSTVTETKTNTTGTAPSGYVKTGASAPVYNSVTKKWVTTYTYEKKTTTYTYTKTTISTTTNITGVAPSGYTQIATKFVPDMVTLGNGVQLSADLWQRNDNQSLADVNWGVDSYRIQDSNGDPLNPWHDATGGTSKTWMLTYNLDEGSLNALFEYALNGSFGIGIDPDCHYFNDGVIFTVVTAPIPEPETYAMLLAGLGLLGFAARRRKLKEAAAA